MYHNNNIQEMDYREDGIIIEEQKNMVKTLFHFSRPESLPNAP
jgi:hypothetical protein